MCCATPENRHNGQEEQASSLRVLTVFILSESFSVLIHSLGLNPLARMRAGQLILIMLIGSSISSIISLKNATRDIQSISHGPEEPYKTHLISRSLIAPGYCTADQYRAFFVALNEVAVWSAICVEKLHTAGDQAMSRVWSIFRNVPRTLESRLILHRRYNSLINEIRVLGVGQALFFCAPFHAPQCQGHGRLTDLNRAAQTVAIVSRLLQGFVAVICHNCS